MFETHRTFFLGFIVVSVSMSLILSPVVGGCTLKGCWADSSIEETIIPCNSCQLTNVYFVSGILNIYNQCGGREMLVIEYGDVKKRYYEIPHPEKCSLDVRLFTFRII